jgi:hypothetical protein
MIAVTVTEASMHHGLGMIIALLIGFKKLKLLRTAGAHEG